MGKIALTGALATALLTMTGLAEAQTIYPIDRATILAGSKFDFKVEFPGVVEAKDVKVTVNGVDHAKALGRSVTFIAMESGVNASAVMLRDVSIDKPGIYKIEATDGKTSKSVSWEVFGTPAKRQARNVILFIGDGLSIANRTAARILSKQITEGKYHGTLAIDDMPHMALIGTAGVDSIITDSANSMSAYTTGHKSSVNALGVYADRTPDPFDDPKVETIAELVKRKHGMAVGVVTNTEIEDATPAGMIAHTRRRAEYDRIVEQFYALKPDVMMGGGSLNFLPKSTLGSKRKDDVDYIAKFKEAGYALATTDAEMKAAGADPKTKRLLGLYHTGNMDGVLDRKFLKKGTVDKFPNQPDLVDQVKVSLDLLSRGPNGFVLMVESGIIDKYNHPLDWERSVWDTIMLDNAVKVAKDFAAKKNDTLVIVVADHAHGISLIGTVDDSKPGPEMREKVGVYDQAGYPNYPAPDAEGYPSTPDVSKRLAIFYNDFPDYWETYKPHMDGPFVPALQKEKNVYAANEQYKDSPGAQFREGNLPRDNSTGVHSGDDVILTATGPGSEKFRGFMPNTDVFRVMAETLALGK
jgi:alkaline phosphatase